MTEFDHAMIRLAIRLARRGEGLVEPNPMVGCVIARDGKIIGRGCHRRYGGPHAEVEALRACGVAPIGATVYVTLEPCCAHEGKKTPPCADKLIAAGVNRVVIGTLDPNPKVHGRGVKQLRRAGIQVRVCNDADASELIAPFRRYAVDRRPYIIAKWAQSLDGKLATGTGDSRWISCAESRRRVHKLRARVDAVLVGIGTVLKDDPWLTARGVRLRRTATRVVLDAHLRIPLNARLVQTAGDVPVAVCTSNEQARSRKAEMLRNHGIDVVACRTLTGARPGKKSPPAGALISLRDVIQMLHQRNMTNLLVEGGPTVLSAFFGSRLVDEAHVYVAPVLIGGRRAPAAVDSLTITKMSKALKATRVQTARCGSDILYRLRFW